jgi:hypothetical protein
MKPQFLQLNVGREREREREIERERSTATLDKYKADSIVAVYIQQRMKTVVLT